MTRFIWEYDEVFNNIYYVSLPYPPQFSTRPNLKKIGYVIEENGAWFAVSYEDGIRRRFQTQNEAAEYILQQYNA